MSPKFLKQSLLLFLSVLLLGSPLAAQKKKKNEHLTPGPPVLWRDPGRLSTRNLFHGPGSAERAPVPPFTFVAEEKTGESPKIRVTDARGVTWIVKMGPEAQAETVATRLVWAVGYFADEAYYLDRVEVNNLPRLSRGQNFVARGNIIVGARLEPRRKDIVRGANWEWEQNPFLGTRELDGLKVLMVLVANYDTSPRNNRVYGWRNARSGDKEAQYVVSDIGATFGRVGGLGGKRTKNSLEDFRSSKFIIGVENGKVVFDYDTTPKKMGKFASIFSPSYRSSQEKKERVMRNISVENARWIGSLLASLSDEQLRDAFRAAHYDQSIMEGFVAVLKDRIRQLVQLRA